MEQSETTEELSSKKLNSQEPKNADKEGDSNFPAEIKNYLNKISSDVSRSSNIKLKKEHQRLTDLLASYNQLTARLREEITSCDKCSKTEIRSKNSKQIEPVLPTIYAALRPDLYKDVREIEKKNLIKKFTQKRFYSPAEKLLPPHTSPPCYVLEDRRQNEKERFCRLLSSTPSRFHNLFDVSSDNPRQPLKNRTIIALKVEDVREKEKDRLAKIFASSNSVMLPKSVQRSKCAEDNRSCDNKLDDNSLRLHSGKKSMVRVGEYSPLNGHHRGITTLGVGEHDVQQKQLFEERKREYVDFMATQRMKTEKDLFNKNEIEMNQTSRRPRMSSASTQTDSEESVYSFQDNQDSPSPVQSVNSSPRRRTPLEITPREKLMSDLYGAPPMTPYQTVASEKEKQIAYAKALRAQIEEKKRLDLERKRKEMKEEELIEKRVREQAERLRVEYQKEQNKKQDWIQQKQVQEEILRRRLQELELESLELKKQERQKKIQKNSEIPESQQKVLQKRSSSLRPSVNTFGPSFSSGTRELPHNRTTFSKSSLLDVAPLLDSDRQNILSARAAEVRRGNDFNDIHSLALGPGVNLLSPQYNSKNKASTTPLQNEPSFPNLSMEEDLATFPSTGHISPRSVNYQSKRSPLPNHSIEEMSSSTTQTHQQISNRRPSSPVVPALQTEMLMKRSPKILEEKRMVSTSKFEETSNPVMMKESVENNNILTQLGEFRRKLAIEHQLLEQRLMHNSS